MNTYKIHYVVVENSNAYKTNKVWNYDFIKADTEHEAHEKFNKVWISSFQYEIVKTVKV